MDDHVVARLRRRIDDARSLGLKVRMEPLDGEQASWCVIAGSPTLFVDLSQTAAEQLQQLEETLAAYLGHLGQSTPTPSTKNVSSPTNARSESADRAA